MLKGFLNILVKELKELIRDPKIFLTMIIIPLIMFPLMGLIMNFSIQSAQEKAEKATLLVLNNDGENYSKDLIDFLGSFLRIVVINDTEPEEVVSLLSKYNTTQFIEIPSGFSANIT